MSAPMEESSETKMYKALQAQKEQLEADLKTVTHIYGKVTASHDYKEFARKTNALMEKITGELKSVVAKISQWDMHFKAQAQYAEMIEHENTITTLIEKYL